MSHLNDGSVESAEHLVSRCPMYAELRHECLRRVESLVTEAKAPRIKAALRDCSAALFLSDRSLMELAPELRWRVDSVLCNYLKLLWRKREEVWSKQGLDQNLWIVG